jgi:hypothetical protein
VAGGEVGVRADGNTSEPDASLLNGCVVGMALKRLALNGRL